MKCGSQMNLCDALAHRKKESAQNGGEVASTEETEHHNEHALGFAKLSFAPKVVTWAASTVNRLTGQFAHNHKWRHKIDAPQQSQCSPFDDKHESGPKSSRIV